MDEHRRAARRKVFYYLEIADRETGKPLGRLGDISPDGIMLLTGEALPLGKRYKISIKLPPGGLFPAGTLDIEIETRWSKPDVNPSLFCTGCVMTDADVEKDAVVGRLVSYYGFSEGYKHLRGHTVT